MRIEDRHIVKLISIKSLVPDTNKMYVKVLQNGIELLVKSRLVREKAKEGGSVQRMIN